jgi:hypothetical protein
LLLGLKLCLSSWIPFSKEADECDESSSFSSSDGVIEEETDCNGDFSISLFRCYVPKRDVSIAG